MFQPLSIYLDYLSKLVLKIRGCHDLTRFVIYCRARQKKALSLPMYRTVFYMSNKIVNILFPRNIRGLLTTATFTGRVCPIFTNLFLQKGRNYTKRNGKKYKGNRD